MLTDNIQKDIQQNQISERRMAANRANAQKSTGPRTQEGKNHSRLNAVRHGLTGQVTIMTADDRLAYDQFCNDIVADWKPEGIRERHLAQHIAEDHWRIYRARAIEKQIMALRQANPGVTIQSDNPEIHNSTSQALAWMNDPKGFALLSLYAQRITRALKGNEARLEAMQAERKAAFDQALEEAQLLTELALSEGGSFVPAHYFQNGFDFAPAEINHRIERSRLLDKARKLKKGPEDTRPVRRGMRIAA